MSVRLAIGDRLAVRSALPDRLFVRLDVEVDEEPEVAREQQASKHRSSLSAGACTKVRPVWEVVGRVVVVCCNAKRATVRYLIKSDISVAPTREVDDEEVDNKLDDLYSREVLLPLLRGCQ